LGFGHPLRGQEHLGANLGSFFIEGVKRIKMLFGNDQEMNRGFRVDVLKNCQDLIFKKDFRRQLSGYNLAKDAGHFHLFWIRLSYIEFISSEQVPFYHRIQGKGRVEPAPVEPDDLNSSTLNPNDYRK
jgi:hypothetical protein